MEDRPVIDAQPPAVPADSGARRKLVAAGLASLIAVGGVFAAARTNDAEPSVRVQADQASTAPVTGPHDGLVPDAGAGPVMPPPPDMTTTAPPRPETSTSTTLAMASTTSTAPLQGTRTAVMSADDGRWRLTRIDTGSRRCLELTAGSSTTGRLLCDASAPTRLWGQYAIVTTPIGRVVVAMADGQLTGMTTLFGDGVFPKFGADPTGDPLHYAVGVIQNLGGASPEAGLDLFLRQGENTLGRAHISLAPGPHPVPEVVTAKPYGSWPGYRKAGYTGLFWGGNEDVGFYDNTAGDGTRCVLWRRFGGPQEGVILDVCPPPADAIFPFAELRTEGSITDLVRPAVVVDAPVSRLTCTWDSGAGCVFSGSGAQVMADPAGSGRSFVAYFPGAFQRHGDRMTVTAYNGETTLGQITLAVQPG